MWDVNSGGGGGGGICAAAWRMQEMFRAENIKKKACRIKGQSYREAKGNNRTI